MRIKNWEKFQHYKNRNPPWIKLHYSILNSEDWVMLTDASRLLMIACMLLASRNNGDIPNNPEYIKKVCNLTKVDLDPLINCGFIDVASICVQNVANVIPSVSVLKDFKVLKDKIKYLDFVMLTEKEYQKLVDKFGGNDAERRIEKLNNYLGSTGKRYKSHYHTILNWASKDKPTIPDGPSPEKKAELERCSYGNCEKKGTVTMNNSKFCREHLEMV